MNPSLPPAIHLRPYQERGIAQVRAEIARGTRRVLMVLPTGGGKCLGRGTPVLRYDGRIVAVEDVRAGDLLMGPDSQPRTVLSTNADTGPLYRVTPVKGAPWVCNDVHILTLVDTTTGAVEDIDVTTYLTRPKTYRHTRKLFAPPEGIDFAPAPPLPIDPYFLGVWFGDGTHRTDVVAVSKPDPEIAALMNATAAHYGLSVRTEHSYNGCPTHYIRGARGAGNPLMRLLREVVGPAMTVPHEYITASRADRLAFLAGFLDTDGYLHNGCYEIIQLRRDYADAIALLARGLGFRVVESVKIVNGKEYQRLSISGETSRIPLRIARKIAPKRRQKKCATRTGFSLTPIGDGEYFGFTLDGDGRFLLGDCTVTHNTVVAASIIAGAVRKQKRALFLAHRRELIDQCYGKLLASGLTRDHLGTILAGDPRARPHAPVQVASVQTLVGRKHPPADLIFVDEAHHTTASTYERILASYPGAAVIGLTATPCRGDGRGLGDAFGALVQVAQFGDLAAEGFLIVPTVYSTRHPVDLSAIRSTAGDYNLHDLDEALNRRELVGDIVSHWQEHAHGRTTVVFAASVGHSRAIVEQFIAAGVRAEHLDGTTDDDERAAILARLATGETTVVANFGVLTEGWDLPRCKCVILARPTKSTGLYLQMAGRGLRPDGDTPALLLDHAGCVLAHGFPQDDREWSLESRRKRAGAAPVKVCPSCYASLPSGTLTCPECGHVFEAPPREEIETVDGALVQVVPPATLPVAVRREWYEQQVATAKSRGWKLGAARHRYREKFGGWPAFSEVERRYYPRPTVTQ